MKIGFQFWDSKKNGKWQVVVEQVGGGAAVVVFHYFPLQFRGQLVANPLLFSSSIFSCLGSLGYYKWEFLEMVWCSSKKRLRNVECCCIVIICKGNVVLSSILKLPNLTGHINYSAHKTKVKFTWKLLQKKVDKHFKYLSTTYVFTNNSTVIV